MGHNSIASPSFRGGENSGRVSSMKSFRSFFVIAAVAGFAMTGVAGAAEARCVNCNVPIAKTNVRTVVKTRTVQQVRNVTRVKNVTKTRYVKNVTGVVTKTVVVPVTRVNTVTRAGSQVIAGIAYSAEANLVATAEFDGRVRFYDPRSDGAVVKVVLTSHAAPVATVAWSPADPQHQVFLIFFFSFFVPKLTRRRGLTPARLPRARLTARTTT